MTTSQPHAQGEQRQAESARREMRWQAAEEFLAMDRGNSGLRKSLQDAVSDAIHSAMEGGMKADEACEVVQSVAVNYWTHFLGDDTAWKLGVMLDAFEMPPPPTDGAK